MRCISSKEKNFADFELKNRKRTLNFGKNDDDEHLLSRICFYYKLEHLNLELADDNSLITDNAIIQGFHICPQLVTLKLSQNDANPYLIEVISQNFTNLKQLCLETTLNFYVTDNHLSMLIEKLQHLESLRLAIPDIRFDCGKCFAKIGSCMKTIDWDVGLGVTVDEDLTFGENSVNLQSFSFKSFGIVNEHVMNVVNNEMPNLENLTVKMRSFDFQWLITSNIKNLTLHVHSCINALCDQKLTAVKNLKLSFYRNEHNSAVIVESLSNFPNVQNLEVKIKHASNKLANVVETLGDLAHLKQFTFSHCSTSANENQRRFLIRMVSSLPIVDNVKLVLKHLDNEDDCDLLLENLKFIAIQRPHILFTLEHSLKEIKPFSSLGYKYVFSK
ncbi:hypothetical protein B4U80_12884 [Leptotrombidium deliense]|uniref:Uncharacterized protein n=1 Tax=Leptotrombidium deliense TaxID=299467 RepID=A0A443SIA7_9ACAR|nr:hypothetical protein B4U80_12884 [Leptotrombidium deliense]